MQKLPGEARGKFTSSSLGVDSARFKGGRENRPNDGAERLRELLPCLTTDSHATSHPTLDTYQHVCTFFAGDVRWIEPERAMEDGRIFCDRILKAALLS